MKTICIIMYTCTYTCGLLTSSKSGHLSKMQWQNRCVYHNSTVLLMLYISSRRFHKTLYITFYPASCPSYACASKIVFYLNTKFFLKKLFISFICQSNWTEFQWLQWKYYLTTHIFNGHLAFLCKALAHNFIKNYANHFRKCDYIK